MIIDIHQKKIALGAKYEIVQKEKTILFAASRLFRFLSEINLFRASDEQGIAQIKRKLSFFKALYTITMSSGSEILFYMVLFWRNHYRCEYRGKTYDIYGHRGRKFSIYKGGKQIAWFEKKAISYFEGDNYRITANDDADVTLLVSFVVVIDNYRSRRHNRGIVNFDIGNIFQARVFDESWRPVIHR